jgi:hypothetical protein
MADRGELVSEDLYRHIGKLILVCFNKIRMYKIQVINVVLISM